MSDPCECDRPTSPTEDSMTDPAKSSRREVLFAGAAVAALPLAPAAQAQTAGNDELARLQRSRRVLLKGGIVLTLDRAVGDFASADVLLEDGKIREVRPNIAVSDSTLAIVDARNRILIPG